MIDATFDMAEFHKHVAQAQKILQDACITAVRAACTEGAQEAKRVHSYKDRTGKLSKSIRGGLTRVDSFGAEGAIVASAKYASFVENGTKPHEIRPKFSGIGAPRPGQSRRGPKDIGTHRIALRWYGADGGVHFARIVHHPGTRPYPFMGPAYLKAERVMEREFTVAAAEIDAL